MAGMTCRPLGSWVLGLPALLRHRIRSSAHPAPGAQRRAVRDEPAGLAVAAPRRQRRCAGCGQRRVALCRPIHPPPRGPPRRPALPRPGIGAPMAGAALVTGATARTVGATMTTAFGKGPGRWTDPHGPTPG